MKFDIALGIFLLLSPIFFLPIQIGNINALQFYQFGVLGNSGYSYLQLLFFSFGIMALFIVALLSKPQREFNNKWIVYLLMSFCASVYFHPIGIKVFSGIFLAFLLYYLVVVYTKDYRKLFKFIFWVATANTVFAILQFFKINLIYQSTGRIDGLMCLSTHLGAYQIIALPICFALNPVFIIIPMIGIILSKSLTAIFIMLCWIAYKVCKRMTSVPVTLVIFSLIAVFLCRNWGILVQKLNIRFMVWIPAIKDIFNHPFLGYGLKPFKFNSPIGLFENTNSIYIGIVWCLGILALIPLFMVIKEIFKSKDRVILTSVLIALLVGIEKSIMDYPRLAGTIIILFGMLDITKEVQVENQV